MTHVALFLPDLELGGAQRVLLMLADAFVKRGCVVSLLVVSKRGLLCESVPVEVELVELCPGCEGWGQGALAALATWRLWWWLRYRRPRVVFSSVTGANIVALLASRLLWRSPRIVIREAGNISDIQSALRIRLLKALYKYADAVIALTPVMAEKLARQLGVARRSLHCIPNKVDINYLVEQSAAPLDGEVLGRLEGGKVIVAVGRFIPQKDFITLVKAVGVVVKKTQVTLVIVGDGVERQSIERVIDQLALRDNIVLAGVDPNPWRWMTRADLFVLSSSSEGHPNALLEALALGLPVVATEYDPSLCEMAARYGFITSPVGDSEALAAAIFRGLKVPRNRVLVDSDMSALADDYLPILLS